MFKSPQPSNLRDNGQHSTPRVFNGENQVTSEMICDDCAGQPHQVRWCNTCSAAICDACILDRHHEHEIICYQKASREAKAAYDVVQARMSKEIEQLLAQRQASVHVKEEIIKKVDACANKLQKRAGEAGDVVDAMKKQLDELLALAQAPLNGKTICDRHHACETSRLLGEKLLKQQEMIERQMKMAQASLDEMGLADDE